MQRHGEIAPHVAVPRDEHRAARSMRCERLRHDGVASLLRDHHCRGHWRLDASAMALLEHTREPGALPVGQYRWSGDIVAQGA